MASDSYAESDEVLHGLYSLVKGKQMRALMSLNYLPKLCHNELSLNLDPYTVKNLA